MIQNVVSSVLIDIRWCDVIQRFVVSLMIVVINPFGHALFNFHRWYRIHQPTQGGRVAVFADFYFFRLTGRSLFPIMISF
jgi:hypothetical protein